MEGSTVLELLQNFKDDSKLQPLLNQLEELQSRVQAADLHNAGDPIVHNGLGMHAKVSSMLATNTRGGYYSQAGGGMLPPCMSVAAAKQQQTSMAPRPSWAAAPQQLPGRSGAGLKVEDAQLPSLLPGQGQPLKAVEGSHDWETLEAAVNEACARFHSTRAKAAWKKWALTTENAGLVASLLWWVVAHVFKPNHPAADAVKEYVYNHFAQQYVRNVLTYKGLSKDCYLDLWKEVLSSSVTYLLKESFPRSAHKFDDELQQFIANQIQRWTSGSLPTDLHPSIYSTVGDPSPAAVMHQQQSVAPPLSPPPMPIPPPPPPIEDDNNVTAAGAAAADPATSAPAGAAAAAAAATGGSSSQQPSCSQQHNHHTQLVEAAAAASSSNCYSLAGGCAFHMHKASPVMSHLFQASNLGCPRSNIAAAPGLRTDKLGAGQAALRHPLDEPSEEQQPYTALARQCERAAQQAVDRYQQSKRAAAKDVLTIRRQCMGAREGLDMQVSELQAGSKVKDLSDKLSRWVENDIDRMMRDAPTSLTAPAAGSTATTATTAQPHYMAARGTGAASGKPSLTRMMAPWSKMRGVEASIQAALSQKRQSSNDVVAHVSAIQRRPTSGRGGGNKGGSVSGGVKGKWSPAPIEYTRGTLDTRISKAAAVAMRGIDFEMYKY